MQPESCPLSEERHIRHNSCIYEHTSKPHPPPPPDNWYPLGMVWENQCIHYFTFWYLVFTEDCFRHTSVEFTQARHLKFLHYIDDFIRYYWVPCVSQLKKVCIVNTKKKYINTHEIYKYRGNCVNMMDMYTYRRAFEIYSKHR